GGDAVACGRSPDAHRTAWPERPTASPTPKGRGYTSARSPRALPAVACDDEGGPIKGMAVGWGSQQLQLSVSLCFGGVSHPGGLLVAGEQGPMVFDHQFCCTVRFHVQLSYYTSW